MKALPRELPSPEEAGQNKRERQDFTDKAVEILITQHDLTQRDIVCWVVRVAHFGYHLRFWTGNWWQSHNGVIDLHVKYDEPDITIIIAQYLKWFDRIIKGEVVRDDFCGHMNLPVYEKPDHIDENKYWEKGRYTYRPDMNIEPVRTLKNWRENLEAIGDMNP